MSFTPNGIPRSGPFPRGFCGATTTHAWIFASAPRMRWRQMASSSASVFSPDSSHSRKFFSIATLLKYRISLVRIALGQINPTVGDLAGNVNLMIRFAREAAAAGARLVVFPELAVCGYPPRDLVEKPSFLAQTQAELERLARETGATPVDIICGFARRSASTTGKTAANCAAYLAGGEIRFVQQKMLLPTYDVFDEGRNFVPGERQSVFPALGPRLAITICEDVWNDKQFW